MTVWPLYGLASAAAIGFAALSPMRERRHAVAMACILFAGWAVYQPLHLISGFEDVNPILDFVIGYIALDMFIMNPKQWKFGVLMCCILMQVAHVVYQVALVFGHKFCYAYAAALNILFLCQLLLVSSMGLKESGRIVGDWLSDYLGGARDYAHRFTLWRRPKE